MATSAHVYFADVPISPVAANPEGHRSTFDSDDDAILQHQNRQTGDRSISPVTAPSRSSPLPPSSPRFERNMGFFRQLSRRFGLRSNDDLVYSGSNEDDNQSSSTDSCSSHGIMAANNSKILGSQGVKELPKHFMSSNSSETSSTVDIEEQQLQLQRERERERDRQREVLTSNSTNLDETVNLSKNEKAKEEEQEEGEDQKPSYHKDRKSFARSSFSRLQRRSTNSIRRAFEAFSLSSRSLSCSGATPPPVAPLLPASHSQSQSHTSSASSSTNNGTPIKSAMKSSSNLELNKKSTTFTAAANLQAAKPKTTTTTTTTILKASSSSSGCCTSSSSSSASTSLSSSSSSSKSKTKPPPQRILRQPVSYTYLKGISGLPTQRVPRSSVCCQYARR